MSFNSYSFIPPISTIFVENFRIFLTQITDLDGQLSSLADLRSNQKERINQLEHINKVLIF